MHGWPIKASSSCRQRGRPRPCSRTGRRAPACACRPWCPPLGCRCLQAGALGLEAGFAHRLVGVGKRAHLDHEAAILAGRRPPPWHCADLPLPASAWARAPSSALTAALGSGFASRLMRTPCAVLARGHRSRLCLWPWHVRRRGACGLLPRAGTRWASSALALAASSALRDSVARSALVGRVASALSLARGATTGAAGAPEATTSSRSPRLAPAGTGCGMRSGATLSLSGMVMGRRPRPGAAGCRTPAESRSPPAAPARRRPPDGGARGDAGCRCFPAGFPRPRPCRASAHRARAGAGRAGET
jgi:hypothetical protein